LTLHKKGVLKMAQPERLGNVLAVVLARIQESREYYKQQQEKQEKQKKQEKQLRLF